MKNGLLKVILSAAMVVIVIVWALSDYHESRSKAELAAAIENAVPYRIDRPAHPDEHDVWMEKGDRLATVFHGKIIVFDLATGKRVE